MSRIYAYQTYLRIILTTGVNIAGALDLKIYYKKPVTGTIDSVDAEVLDEAQGKIYYDVEPDSEGNSDFLDEVGKWKFWAYVVFSDGREARGDTITRMVYDKEDAC